MALKVCSVDVKNHLPPIYPINFAPAMPIPAPSITEKTSIGTMAFLSFGQTIIMRGNAVPKAIKMPVIHGASPQFTNGITKPSTT